MPSRISGLMILIAVTGLALAAFMAGGRWYYAADESVRSPFWFLLGVGLTYSIVFGSIITPILLCDMIRDARARRLEALATRMAELDRMRSQSKGCRYL